MQFFKQRFKPLHAHFVLYRFCYNRKRRASVSQKLSVSSEYRQKICSVLGDLIPIGQNLYLHFYGHFSNDGAS